MSEEDKERGLRLVNEIARLSQTDVQVMDSDFGWSVMRVGRAMAPKGEDFLAAGADLAEYLLSDRPLNKGERRELACMVLGVYRRPATKPQMHASHPLVVAAVEALREGAPQKVVAHKFGISIGTVRNYKKMADERDAAIEAAKAIIQTTKMP